MRLNFAFPGALFLMALVLASAVSAAPADSAKILKPGFTQGLERTYLQLVSKDPQVQNPAQWERLTGELNGFVDNGAAGAELLDALFLLGEINEYIYNTREFSLAGAQASAAYARFVKEAGADPRMERALLSLGDLKLRAVHDRDGAKQAYAELIARYPSTPSARNAQEKLQRLADSNSGNSEIEPVFGRPKGPEISRPDTTRRPIIVIDPGHGGEDLGAQGIDGVLEKDVALNIVMYLDELLRDRLRAKTVITRVRDVVVPLQERTKIANDAKADLFVSIHTNASPSHAGHGIETYYLDNTDDRSSLKLAERENLSVSYGGSTQDLDFILSDLIQDAKLDDSISLAHHLQDSLYLKLSHYFPGVRNLGVKRAPFFVLVGAHMPCVLAEVSFIDHPVEGSRLIERRYQRLIAEALFEGMQAFFLKTQKQN